MVLVPKVDDRTSQEIFEQVRKLLSLARDEEDRQEEPAEDLVPGKGFADALIRVFARFAELVIHRLNQAPEKNFLAFLDLLGVSQLPMQAARVPLSFQVSSGTTDCVTVPAGTQVAAPPPKGEKKPIIFETETELVLTPAKLDSLFSKSGGRDQYRDLGSTLLLSAESEAGGADLVSSPPEALPIPHAFYMALPVNPSWLKIDTLRIRVALDEGTSAGGDERLLQWEVPAENLPRVVPSKGNASPGASVEAQPETKIVLTPPDDGSKNLTESGDVVFHDFPFPAPVAIDGLAGNWLACSLLTPITCGAAPERSMVRASQLPAVKQMTCEMDLSRQGLAIEQAFYNGQKLDLSKDFFPFGERPKFGDVFYLASREVFSDPDAKITLHVELTNPESASSDVGIPNTATHNTQLSWEFWNGQEWTSLGKTGKFLRVGDAGTGLSETEFADGTKSLSNNGEVSFRFSSRPQQVTVNGQKNYWIRARIAAGNYGEQFHFEKDTSPSGMVAKPATLAPPSIRSIKLDYVAKKEAPPLALVTYNDFTYAHVQAESPFKPFVPVSAGDVSPFIYFGFTVDPPAGAKSNSGSAVQGQLKQAKFPNQPVTAYVASQETDHSAAVRATRSAVRLWQYWNGSEWARFSVRDETQSFRRSGLIQFLPPADFATKKEFGRERYWLRLQSDADGVETAIRHVFLNTTVATQGISVVKDLLGTSNGKANQKFQAIQPMVLAGQELEVREPTLPPKEELDCLEATGGRGAVKTIKDPATLTDQYWVTWQEVPNFYGSGPRDRHYILDHVKGEITFGDGASGLIPPVLPGNIRVARYRSGGGAAGNLGVGTITKLSAAIPGIQKVMNWLPTSGGCDEEGYARLLERGSRGVRHGERAVTLEDFEDLAMLASREVARAKCVPLYDLSVVPETRRSRPGIISVIIVPDSPDPRPTPSAGLVDRVRDFLEGHRLPTVDLVVAGPEYVTVDVDAEVVVDHPEKAHDVELAIRQELDRYLHPVTGGADGNGWEFGQLPRKFDLTVLIERISGVSYVRDLRVNTTAAVSGSQKTLHFLVCRGRCRITTILEEQSAVEFA